MSALLEALRTTPVLVTSLASFMAGFATGVIRASPRGERDP